ncbi:LytTR family DNA-binding domain-containing protein [Clostridium sp. AM58-1XD]|uniref:LytR/AlgR family response regulator transcription factor n=1 Tax=Clostridium sp. AM58-1XD TaxID=2292307 RepID=UPI000E4A434F|nr:LytTR family DNA-binding domain-containing protein [Clostridium sp. AM58-1XD]RGY97394.1 DNA-binding response regulator [Clostridium sp. AM58-1XD]
MLNILICDDEKPFLDRLANKITVYLKNREIPFQMAAFSSGEELLKHSEDRPFDIAFLDISMNAISGMDAAECLRDRNQKICIVFVTGYMDYVLEGYKVGALRYLVKDSLEISFEECMEAVLKKFHIDTDEICLEFTDRKRYLKADEICLVESRGHKLLFLAVDGKHVIGTMNRKLTDVEGLLGGHGFLRVHQSYMVNMKYIVNIASYRLELEPDIILHVPRNRYPYVKREYAIYKGDSL